MQSDCLWAACKSKPWDSNYYMRLQQRRRLTLGRLQRGESSSRFNRCQRHFRSRGSSLISFGNFFHLSSSKTTINSIKYALNHINTIFWRHFTNVMHTWKIEFWNFRYDGGWSGGRCGNFFHCIFISVICFWHMRCSIGL
jgi:hypothetical protein